jgi:hypothetical protein
MSSVMRSCFSVCLFLDRYSRPLPGAISWVIEVYGAKPIKIIADDKLGILCKEDVGLPGISIGESSY